MAQGKRADRFRHGGSAGVWLAAATGRAGAVERAGHPARDVQPAARGADRYRDGRRIRAAATSGAGRSVVRNLSIRRFPKRPCWDSNTASAAISRRRWCCGKRSSAISRTARRSSSTSSSPRAKTSGICFRAWCCCCRTAMKGRGRSIPARASSAFCNWRRATTFRFASLRPRRSIFICCGGRRCARGANRWWCSRRKACCAIRRRLRRLRIWRTARFQTVIPDAATDRPTRVLLCTGKIGHELIAERKRRKDTSTAIVFLEQLYPFPEAELAAEMDRHAKAREFVWVQEEPANMGALAFLLPRLERLARGRAVLSVKRSASASPATGSHKAHEMEQNTLLRWRLAAQRKPDRRPDYFFEIMKLCGPGPSAQFVESEPCVCETFDRIRNKGKRRRRAWCRA